VWELGNEVNLYLWNYGLLVGGAQLARDAMVLRGLLHELGAKARVAAPASAYWPVLGEIPPQVYADFLAAGAGQAVDVLTWHYYPQQSADCDVHTRRAASGVLLHPFTLNEVAQWAAAVEQGRNAHAPHVPIWLGETGNAQCGGAPGISDAFEGGFWWLDQLGLVARRGQPVVIRQTLSGGAYGLIDDATLVPNPDYFSAVLWKRLMGPRVLAAQMQRPVWSRQVRIYAHCTPPAAEAFAPGAVSVVLINLSLERSATVDFATVAGPAWLYALTAPALSSRQMFLNGIVLKVRKDGTPPVMAPVYVPPTRGHPRVTLAPASYAFVVLPEADAAACR
jgi:heparanase 1